SKGEPTNAVFGFTSILLKALEETRPEYAAVTFDVAKPTFRHQAYAEYKGTRPRMADDLRPQFARVHQVVQALNIPIFEVEGYEADDLLGCLARQAEATNVDTIIMTGDLDTLQLVTPRVRVMAPKGRISETVMYDVAAVQERYGLEPAQIPDLKALSGDTSDNIKGVSGVGQKTAAKLLAEFGTVEGIYERLDDVQPAKLRDALRENERLVRSNKQLATIDRAAPCVLDLDACRLADFEREKVLALFQELEFRSLLAKIPHTLKSEASPNGQLSFFEESAASATPAPEPDVVAGKAQLGTLVKALTAAKRFFLHPVATQRSPIDFEVEGFALATGEQQGWYVPLSEAALDALRRVVEDEKIGKVCHNAKATISLLAERGLTLRGLEWDTMIAAYLLNQSIRSASVRDLIFQSLAREVENAPVLEAQLLWKIAAEQRDDLAERKQLDLFNKVELPLVPVLSALERAGIKVDVNVLGEMNRELTQQITQIELEIYNAVGHQFTINSPQQLGKVLVDELHLPLTKRTKTGWSTDATVLEELVGTHPVIEHILSYRQLTKLRSTYIEALPALINPRTGRIHTTFNQAVAATGRLSSEAPNLQNIPIRTELGRRIRRAFVAEGKDMVLLTADYAQIELRIAAHITGDALLKAAFEADEDVHTSTASVVFGVPPEKVTPEQRRLAKTTNFAVLYGISDFGLAQRVGISRDEAGPFIEAYLGRYEGVRRYIEQTKRDARKRGYVETPLGRRRSMPELHSPNRAVREAGERAAINMPIQGAQADLIKLAMIEIHQALEQRGLRTRMLLQVHDELVFEVPRRELAEVVPLVRDEMETAMTFDVPVKVEMKTGTNWYDMGPVELSARAA
ncbi:MAG TPA: DNA polymerase I, partial [Chloroflexota bacterium]|nr:DNA polymerase I [Chloroflexota bacterium]